MNFVLTVFLIAYLTVLLIALFAASKITKNKKVLIPITVIWLLFPAWDVFFGYPVYWYLHKFDSGIKVYKTFHHVEGFYVGETDQGCEPNEPYKGYRYIDYREKWSGKYYRKYWCENTDTNGPVLRNVIRTKEINKRTVSEFWLYDDSLYHRHGSLLLSFFNAIRPSSLLIQNVHNGLTLGRYDTYLWEGSWLSKIGASVNIESRRGECGCAAKTQKSDFFVHLILKSAPFSDASSPLY